VHSRHVFTPDPQNPVGAAGKQRESAGTGEKSPIFPQKISIFPVISKKSPVYCEVHKTNFTKSNAHQQEKVNFRKRVLNFRKKT